MDIQKEALISVKLGSKSVTQVTNEVLDLMTGSIDLAGAGMVLGGTHRDLDIVADTQEELDNFLGLLKVRGYNFKIQA